EAQMPRNIYIITATGLRPSHLSSHLYQNSQTPAMDFLAYDGIRFLNAFTTSPESLSAHLSMLTGLYPFHRALRNTLDGLLPDREATATAPVNMPEWFRERGYRTAVFASDPELRYPSFLKKLFGEVFIGPALPPWKAAYDPPAVCKLAGDWVLRHRAEPQLVLLNFAEPTLPFEPPPPFDRHYARHPYDGEIAALDREVGIWINTLKRAGLFENSIVVFASPFGESLGDAVRIGSVSEQIIRIPLFIAAPGILPRHQEYEAAVSLVDVFPTLLKLLEANHSLQFDGLALFQKGNDEQVTRKLVFGETRIPALFDEPAVYFARTRQSQYTTGSMTSENPLRQQLAKRLAREGLPDPANVKNEAVQFGPVLEEIRITAMEGRLDVALQLVDSLLAQYPTSQFLQWYRSQIIFYSSESKSSEPAAANR
ncbi:MAG TPA: sulfatase-like hydrolase/transferase, partial [Acidobacteriota bacterium]